MCPYQPNIRISLSLGIQSKRLSLWSSYICWLCSILGSWPGFQKCLSERQSQKIFAHLDLATNHYIKALYQLNSLAYKVKTGRLNFGLALKDGKDFVVTKEVLVNKVFMETFTSALFFLVISNPPDRLFRSWLIPFPYIHTYICHV